MKKKDLEMIANMYKIGNIMEEFILTQQSLGESKGNPQKTVLDGVDQLEIRSRQANEKKDKREQEIVQLIKRVDLLQNIVVKEMKGKKKLKKWFSDLLKQEKHATTKRIDKLSQMIEADRRKSERLEKTFIKFARFYFVNADIDSLKDIEKKLQRMKTIKENGNFKKSDRYLEG